MTAEDLVLNDLDDYCCLCGWWHNRYADVGHEPVVTLQVYDEIQRYQREIAEKEGRHAEP